MTAKPFPIILCGKSREVGQPVMDHLKPEYEAIKFIMSIEEGVSEIPGLLKGGDIFAVVTGGGYDDEAFGTLKKSADDAGCPQVPWLRPDKSKPGPQQMGVGISHANVIAERTKAILDELRQQGAKREGIHLF